MAEATETALASIREEVERAFSSAPGAVLEAALSRIAPADECARAAAYTAWDSIAHPLGGLGDFEDAVACIAAAQGSAEVAEFPRALAVFFSDNGVVAEGVSQSGQDVTRAVARNMCEGATSACRMAAFAGAEVVPVDVGMARGIEDARMVRANVRRGSGNIAHGSAMSRDGAVRAIEVGIAVACGLARAGVRLLAAGEMGIGNTTTASAVASAPSSAPGFAPVRFSPVSTLICTSARLPCAAASFSSAYTVDGWNTVSCSPYSTAAGNNRSGTPPSTRTAGADNPACRSSTPSHTCATAMVRTFA